MAFRWVEVYKVLYDSLTATTDGQGIEVSGNVNGTAIARLWKSGELGKTTISDASSTGGYNKSISRTVHFPRMLNEFTTTYSGRRNYHKRGPFMKTTHHYGSYSWSANGLTSGGFDLREDRTNYTSGSASFSASDNRYVEFSFGAQTTGCTINRDEHHIGGITLYIQLSDYFQNNILYYRRTGHTDVFPSAGIGTTDPNIKGSATLSLPMSAGASWTNGITQYYKTGSYALKAISSQMSASTHVVKGGSISFVDIDSTSTFTLNGPTSVSISSSTTMQASNGSSSVVFTSGTLKLNGSTRNCYIRDLRIRLGYW